MHPSTSTRQGSARLLALLAPAAIFLAAWWWFDAGQPTAAQARVDVPAIQARVASRFLGADNGEILRAHRALSEREPELIERLHGARLSTGRFVALDVPRHIAGAPIEYPKVAESAEAHGLVRVHVLEDGRYVKTELRLEELGDDAAWAVEMAWLQARISESR